MLSAKDSKLPEMLTIEDKAECYSLTEDEYARYYKPFLQCTDNLENLISLIEPVVASFSGKPVSIMSIGAGTGYFEDEMVRKLDLKLSHFHAAEPNKNHHKLLLQTMLSWENVDFTIEEKYFTEKYETQHKFDLILMCHCLYNMDNIPQVLSKACSLLNESGKLAVFIHSEVGGAELYNHAINSVKYLSPPLGDQSVTSKSVCKILTDLSISHVVRERPCTLDVTDFVKKQRPGNDVVSFLIQTRIEKLPEELQKDLYEIIMKRATCTGNGRYLLLQPTVLVEITTKN